MTLQGPTGASSCVRQFSTYCSCLRPYAPKRLCAADPYSSSHGGQAGISMSRTAKNVLAQENSCLPWEQGAGTAPGQWETERPLRVSHRLLAKRLTPCCTDALFSPSESCQASGLVLPTRLCLKKFTLIYKPDFFLSSFSPNRTSLFTARNSFPSLVFMLCEYL